METFERIFITPQMLLYALAYLLLGKRYEYKFGQNGIRPVDEVMSRDRVFVLLFPMLLLGSVGILLQAIWLITFINSDFLSDPMTYYFQIGPIWHQLIHLTGILCFGYGCGSLIRLPTILRLLLDKEGDNYPSNSQDHYRSRDSY